jgi:hypothetical protein
MGPNSNRDHRDNPIIGTGTCTYARRRGRLHRVLEVVKYSARRAKSKFEKNRNGPKSGYGPGA